MTEIKRIEDQLKRSLEGEAWHGPALEELLADVTAEQAATKPLPAAHSIWEIVLHITSDLRVVCERLQGKPTVLPAEEDWPSITDKSEDAWSATKQELRSMNVRLRQAILLLTDKRLEKPIVEGFSSTYMTLHGTVQHSLYHAGQIAILRKHFIQT